ncbi:membrane protein [Helicobacter pylori UM077]|nr:membrane protein [Helicobacter pylori UM077]
MPKMRSGAFLYSVPSVNLVHWYFNAPLKVVAKPWLKFLVVAGFRLSAILASFLKSL